jgi:hypothetical protein
LNQFFRSRGQAPKALTMPENPMRRARGAVRRRQLSSPIVTI